MKKPIIIAIVSIAAFVSLGLGYFIWSVKKAAVEKFTIIDNELLKLDSLQKAGTLDTLTDADKIRKMTDSVVIAIEKLKMEMKANQ